MKRIYLLMFAIMTFSMVATAQESAQVGEKKVANFGYDRLEENWGVTYVADLNDMSGGLLGWMMDCITPTGWDTSARYLTNLFTQGPDNMMMLFKMGANYCPSYTKTAGFYIPIMANIGMSWYDEIDDEGKTESKMKFIYGLSVEPTAMVNLGGLHLSVGLDINWYNITKEIDTLIAFGVTF